jgi:hypothetical protein
MGEDIAILAQDITERKAAEKTSEENVFRFQSLFNENVLPVQPFTKFLMTDNMGRITLSRISTGPPLKQREKKKQRCWEKACMIFGPKLTNMD